VTHAGVVVAALVAVTMTRLAFASGEECQILYYSVWAIASAILRRRSARSTRFFLDGRGDRDMCAAIGAVGDCAGRHITGVRYIVDQVGETNISFRA
jgi:hypothetical protein